MKAEKDQNPDFDIHGSVKRCGFPAIKTVRCCEGLKRSFNLYIISSAPRPLVFRIAIGMRALERTRAPSRNRADPPVGFALSVCRRKPGRGLPRGIVMGLMTSELSLRRGPSRTQQNITPGRLSVCVCMFWKIQPEEKKVAH